MQINSASNPDYIFLTKSNRALIKHIFSVKENLSVFQDLVATGKILNSANIPVASAIPVYINVINKAVSDQFNPGEKIIYVNLTADITSNLDSLNTSERYQFVFEIAYSENSTLINAFSANYFFEVLENAVALSIGLKDSDPVSPAAINSKLANLVAPGVITGMEIFKTSGQNMFGIRAGEAISATGLKYKISQENHNVIKVHDVPASGVRIDAVCITDGGAVVIVPGTPNFGTPWVDEADGSRTVIGYIYVSDTMLSLDAAKCIVRYSLSKRFERQGIRIFSEDITNNDASSIMNPPPPADGKIRRFIPANVSPESVVVFADNNRLFPTDFEVFPGSNTIIVMDPVPEVVSASKFLVDYDLKKNKLPSQADLESVFIPAPEAYPWSGAEAQYNNAFINASHLNNIVTDWDNMGSLGADSNFVFAKYNALAPDAYLNAAKTGVVLPMNDINKISANISIPTATRTPHTAIFALSVNQIRNGMLIKSNSYEPGPLYNFSVNMINAPGNLHWEISHAGLTAQSVLGLSINTKQVFVFRLSDTGHVTVFINATKILDASAASLGGFMHLSEIYLKNELNPTIYYVGYWGESLSDARVSAISSALINNALI